MKQIMFSQKQKFHLQRGPTWHSYCSLWRWAFNITIT